MPKRLKRVESAVFVSICLLLAATLVQAPIAVVEFGENGVFLLRAWDCAWIAFAVSVAAVMLSSRVSGRFLVRTWSSPLAFLWGFAFVGALSLAWLYANFGLDGFPESVNRALRIIGTALVAAAYLNIRTPTRDRALVLVIIAVALAGSGMAVYGWQWMTHPLGPLIEVGVTRSGGPFGYGFADGTYEPWWADPGGANSLGLWLGVALAVLLSYSVDLVWRRPFRWSVALGAMLCAMLLVAGLVATHSRESWVATLGAGIVILFIHPSLSSRPIMRAATVTLPVLVAVSLALALPSAGDRVIDSATPGTFAFETGPAARADSFAAGLEWSAERFPLGWGLGGVEEHPEQFDQKATAENMFIQVLAQMGAVGFVCLVGLCWTGFRGATERARIPTRPTAAVFPAAFFAVFILHGVFGNTVSDPTIQILLALAAAMSVTSVRRNGGTPEPPPRRFVLT